MRLLLTVLFIFPPLSFRPEYFLQPPLIKHPQSVLPLTTRDQTATSSVSSRFESNFSPDMPVKQISCTQLEGLSFERGEQIFGVGFLVYVTVYPF
jgi:hypothetical protein